MQNTDVMDPLMAMTPVERRSIVKAARLAVAGKHGEAEAARYAGGYHNLATREDADRA